jgi:His-Xaa-Ser system radical SAM maturase HxsB
MARSKNNKIDLEKVNFFRSRKLGKKYLVTNDTGDFVYLNDPDYRKFISGSLGAKSVAYKELLKKGFIRNRLDFTGLIKALRSRKNGLFAGPTLHIVVVTLRCNFKCVYCHASAESENKKGLDMSIQTAKKVVDTIFHSPSKDLRIEFQGGEPLLNWEVVKFIIDYAREKEKVENKNIDLALVSNFSLMDDEKIKYLASRKVSVCASFDGPEAVHNKNRVYTGGNNYKQVVYWMKRAAKIYTSKKGKTTKPGALTTITKFSLNYGKQIVDEYVALGLPAVYLRSLNPFGNARPVWEKIGYSAEDFIKFYIKTLDYILLLNKRGKKIREALATTFLVKMLTQMDPGHMDYRSPCGAAIGQLAYDYNGNVYTCDEGRMFGVIGDDTFLLGNVNKTKYEKLVNNDTVHAMCDASLLENVPGCHDCAYSPYCGVCPIYNYSQQGSIVGHMPTNDRCKINKAIFDRLFLLLQKKDNYKIFRNWILGK